MRIFNDYEKTLIGRMIELDKPGHLIVLNNIICNDLPDECYVSMESEDKVKLFIQKQLLDENPPIETIHSYNDVIIDRLLTIVTLFEYLSQERLAYLYGDTGSDKFGKYVDGVEYVPTNFIETDIGNTVFKYGRKKIFISETMRQIVKNGFKTEEQINFENSQEVAVKSHNVAKESLGVTRTGIYVSIGAVLVSLAALAVSIWAFEKQFSSTSSVEVVNKEDKVVPVSLNGEQAKLLKQTAEDVTSMKAFLKDKITPARAGHR